ncbi:hypothetical protein NC653_041884 [Populus alba x Populus x berolinensis]|uniref:Uncharacterized protein n=1 Tax=Populus alba x Populus x berolinensis TaxID=444605 RepID=A0AAD6LAJ0_9ROSI|nr:hypothetical protein NC653_041884 [Populus alba x Populus x berolinensis]
MSSEDNKQIGCQKKNKELIRQSIITFKFRQSKSNFPFFLVTLVNNLIRNVEFGAGLKSLYRKDDIFDSLHVLLRKASYSPPHLVTLFYFLGREVKQTKLYLQLHFPLDRQSLGKIALMSHLTYIPVK